MLCMVTCIRFYFSIVAMNMSRMTVKYVIVTPDSYDAYMYIENVNARTYFLAEILWTDTKEGVSAVAVHLALSHSPDT